MEISARESETWRNFRKAVFVANTGFALFNFRMSLIEHLCTTGWEVIAAANDEGNYKSKFAAKGINFVDLQIDHKGKNPFFDMLFIAQLFRLYKLEKPNLVHHFTIKPVIYGSVAAKLARVPRIVNTVTGLGYAFLKDDFFQKMVANLYRIALVGRPSVIFQNQDDQDFFVAKGIIKEHQSHLVPGSGVDTKKVYPIGKKRANICLKFLFVSRMLWSKGVAEFVAAAEKVKRQYPEVEFLMAGGFSGGGSAANPDAVPVQWLQEKNDRKIITWLGRISNEKVLLLMDQCDVFVLPSYYPEGIPRTMIEACAMGKPIITTDTPGCREAVRSGENGFLVRPKDIGALVEKMRYFLLHPDEIITMGDRSRYKAETDFDEEIVISKTCLIYKKAEARC